MLKYWHFFCIYWNDLVMFGRLIFYAINVMTSWWLDRYFLRWLKLKQNLSRALCVCFGNAFNTKQRSLQLSYLSLLLVKSLKISQKWEFKAFACLSWVCGQSWSRIWLSRFSIRCWSSSKPLFLKVSPSAFLPKFLNYSCMSQLLSITSRQPWLITFVM